MTSALRQPEFKELRNAMAAHRRSFVLIAAFSAIINLLYLAPSIYMMQVYDRVLTSRSEMTLLMLSLLIISLYAVMGLLEAVRSLILVRLGNAFDSELSSRVFRAAFERNLKIRTGAASIAINDLMAIRQFITGNGLFAFLDAPWAPIYITVVWMFHPALGMVALGGVITLMLLALVTELVTRRPLSEANMTANRGSTYANNTLRNAEIIEAMGMLPALMLRWRKLQDRMLSLQSIASDRAGLLAALTKFARMILQSAALGVGALLVLENKVTPGIMIAASILIGRALAPMELLIGSWKQFVAMRVSWQRLDDLLMHFPTRVDGMKLPAPQGRISLEGVSCLAPGGKVPIVQQISIQLSPGEIIGIIGPSASGKSTLARLLVGVWTPTQGKIRIDGADMSQWSREDLGPHIGYLPQDIELFAGTVAENIARFGNLDSEAVVAAAKMAGVHDMILRLPQGYDTPIGDGGNVLSGGQRQRIALARALHGKPCMLVLDEPNASLDETGERALLQALLKARSSGCGVVLITHRPSILGVTDRLVVMKDGQVALQGPRNDVLTALQTKASPTHAAPSSRPEPSQ